MLNVEENIVNIAMMAQKLLSINAIRQDEMEGYAGLTANIINLARKFEEEYGHIDYNAEVKPEEAIPDYWDDIDNFAKKHLLDLYGVEKDYGLSMQYAYVIMPKREIAEIEKKLKELQEENSMEGLGAGKNIINKYQVTFENQKTMDISLIVDRGKKPYLDFILYDSDKKQLAHNTAALPFVDRAVYLISDDVKYKTYLLPFTRSFQIEHGLKWDEQDPDRITGKLECNGALLNKILRKEAENCSREYLEKIIHGYYPLAFAAYNLSTGDVDIAGSFKYLDDGFIEKSHSFHYSLDDTEKQEAMEMMEAYAKKTLGYSLREFQNAERGRYELGKMVEQIDAPLDIQYRCMPLNSKIHTAKNKQANTSFRKKTEMWQQEK